MQFMRRIASEALLRPSGSLFAPLLRNVALRLAPCAAQQLVSLRSFRLSNSSPAASSGEVPTAAPSRRLLVLHPASLPEHSLQEALRLGESYVGEAPDFVEVGSATRLRPSPATFFGSGQVQSLLTRVQATNPERIFVNHALSGVQQRNLERALGRPVLDRVALIIEIFSQRARTNEARLQVELASLEYASSRLVRIVDAATGRRTAFGLGGDTEVVSARERGRSGSSTGGLGGAGGQGESELQLQRRRISIRRKQLLRRLDQVRKTRAVQRAARQRSGKPQVAIVGYTNAGKSSLLSALSKCGEGEAGVEDRLFATLDPTLRRVMLPGSRRDVILSDTVGFISDLPTQLIEAFQATLEEVTEADLLLHVLDASSPQVLQQRKAVLQVLRELGVSQERLEDWVIEVWNKIDQLPQPSTADQNGAADISSQAGKLPENAAPYGASLEAGNHSRAHSAGAVGDGSGAGAGMRAAAAAGLLPPAVEALLASDAAAAGYRPAAVATSVLHGQGLRELLQTVEDKLHLLLDSRRQVSRRQAKIDGASLQQQLEREDAAALQAPAG